MKIDTVKVIAEVGINHHGSTDEAIHLIDQAKFSGCWGVKFQYRDLSTFYQSTDEIGDGILIEELERVDLSIEQYIRLAQYAHSIGINAGVSFFRLEDYMKFEKAKLFFDFYKIPSAECTNLPLIQTLIDTGKPLFVSTGGHSEEQITDTLAQFSNYENLAVLHCVANYPASLGSQNLGFISRLKEMGFQQVGYSSHDEDIEICLMSLCMGISWLERHITNDVNGQGLDDSSSSEVDDFITLSRFIENISGVLGSGTKLLNQGEILNMQNLGTGLYLKEDCEPGTTLSLEDFEVKAPRKGVSVGDFLSSYGSLATKRPIRKRTPLEARHFSESRTIQIEKSLDFAKERKIGIPVRLHDFAHFKNIIPINVYEFHLSYQEAIGGVFEDTVSLLKDTDTVSIHLPDYLPGNRIIDPVSDNHETYTDSRKLIENISILSNLIEQKIGKKVPVVGSFSETNDREREVILDDLFTYFDELQHKVSILPQWLPVYAWYFGGTAKLTLFNSPQDIEYLIKNDRKICLDLCHLVLSANYFQEDWRDWYSLLEPLNRHFHLADAKGVDGEGLPLGSGEIGNLSEYIDTSIIKIIEVWQGHFNDGEGFINALAYLEKTYLKE